MCSELTLFENDGTAQQDSADVKLQLEQYNSLVGGLENRIRTTIDQYETKQLECDACTFTHDSIEQLPSFSFCNANPSIDNNAEKCVKKLIVSKLSLERFNVR